MSSRPNTIPIAKAAAIPTAVYPKLLMPVSAIFLISRPNPIITIAVPRSGDAILPVRAEKGFPKTTVKRIPPIIASPGARFRAGLNCHGSTKKDIQSRMYRNFKQRFLLIQQKSISNTINNETLLFLRKRRRSRELMWRRYLMRFLHLLEGGAVPESAARHFHRVNAVNRVSPFRV